jgi:hypothetical protein
MEHPMHVELVIIFSNPVSIFLNPTNISFGQSFFLKTMKIIFKATKLKNEKYKKIDKEKK